MTISDWPVYFVDPDTRPDELLPLHPLCNSIQFSEPLREDTYKRLGQVLGSRPEITLRLGGYAWEPGDLRFLKWFSSLKRFMLWNRSVTSLNGLENLPQDLHTLSIGETQRPLNLSVLEKFPAIRSLSLTRHTKSIEVLRMFSKLRALTLSQITLPNLSLVAALPQLRILEIILGGTRDLSHLAYAKNLRYVELCQVRLLEDLSIISHLGKLAYLNLRALRNVRELPSLRCMTSLRYLQLWKMSGIRNFTPIAEAPGLKELCLIDMGHLEVADLRPLLRHPTLRYANFGLCGERKNEAATQLIGLNWKGAKMSDGPSLRRKTMGNS